MHKLWLKKRLKDLINNILHGIFVSWNLKAVVWFCRTSSIMDEPEQKVQVAKNIKSLRSILEQVSDAVAALPADQDGIVSEISNQLVEMLSGATEMKQKVTSTFNRSLYLLFYRLFIPYKYKSYKPYKS